MCVYNVTDPETLSEDMIAYKVVMKRAMSSVGYTSMYAPASREAQARFCPTPKSFPKHKGDFLTYRLGEKTSSGFENTPGLYCFRGIEEVIGSLSLSIDWHRKYGAILEVMIPKGSKIRGASSYEDYQGTPEFFDTILAEELIPIKEIPSSEYLPMLAALAQKDFFSAYPEVKNWIDTLAGRLEKKTNDN